MISRNDFSKKQILWVFSSEGDKISFKNDNIIVSDKEGVIKHQSTCYRLFMVCIIGDITITSGIIQRAHKFGFSICMMTKTLRLYEIIGHKMDGNTLLHKKQYEHVGSEIGKRIISNKLMNQKEAIKHLRVKSEDAKDIITKIEDLQFELHNKNELRSILGIEGTAAKLYFKEIFSTADWRGRHPRIKTDYINSILDIGYTILFNFVDALLRTYDFDTYYGVLHTCFYMRKSLVCDLMEPLRPLIDLQVRKSINYGQFKEEHFVVLGNRHQLKWEYNSKYIRILLEPIIENKDEIFTYIRDYYRAFMKGIEPSEFPMYNLFNKEGK